MPEYTCLRLAGLRLSRISLYHFISLFLSYFWLEFNKADACMPRRDKMVLDCMISLLYR